MEPVLYLNTILDLKITTFLVTYKLGPKKSGYKIF